MGRKSRGISDGDSGGRGPTAEYVSTPVFLDQDRNGWGCTNTSPIHYELKPNYLQGGGRRGWCTSERRTLQEGRAKEIVRLMNASELYALNFFIRGGQIDGEIDPGLLIKGTVIVMNSAR